MTGATYEYLCAHVDRGERCSRPGTRSPGTMNRGPSGNGADGPWYCAQHDPQLGGMGTYTEPEPREELSSFSITEQQWYNVCKFFPKVARRCRRPFADVGKHNPLDVTSSMGFLGKAKLAPTIDRQPGEDDQ